MTDELARHYPFAEAESRLYKEWEEGGHFKPTGDGKAFTVVIPPPNVTGSLHIGHALNNTIQDVMVRVHRMRGERVLWQPGTDHAGIATQMVVEKALAEEGTDRRTLGKEKFLERVWAWKAKSEDRIINQLRRLGASADWSRQRFTLDAGLSQAVREIFVRMYDEGLVYKDKRLVNWDPVLETAISDLEILVKETKGSLWHIRYDLVDAKAGEGLVIATTRPETMWGDSAVAVHPADERYRHLIGRKLRIPVVDREITIVADVAVDTAQGSGALKVTPAHDHTDFAIGKRHNLAFIEIFTPRATLREIAEIKQSYWDLPREAAREQIIAELQAGGHLLREEEIVYAVPTGDRSGAVIEPYLSEQWYVDAKRLALPAIAAVEDGDIQFVPSFWENTYFSWMRNIEPWCISRQLWWGHQIPAWYGEDGTIFVACTEKEAQDKAQEHYGKEVTLVRDADVLDTWFSSALWPFSTLGWPQDSDSDVLKRHYPTSVLLTGFDIIFFWVARMIMAGYFALGEKPFHRVYVHALVRDVHGQKMSKSKGNVLDPMALIEKYGCDALRFSLTMRAIPGRDVKIGDKEVTLARNFVTKIWNAARFSHKNGVRVHLDRKKIEIGSGAIHRFILTRLHMSGQQINEALEHYRFDTYSQVMYHFIWDDFCDWYIEWCKEGENLREVTADWREVAGYVFGVMLHWLHPLMPYLSEELWHKLGGKGLLIVDCWPNFADLDRDIIEHKQMKEVMQIVTSLRSLAASGVLSQNDKVTIKPHDKGKTAIIEAYCATICALVKISDLTVVAESDGVMMILPEATLIGFSSLETRAQTIVADLGKERANLTKELDRVSARLGNKDFLDKATPEAVLDAKKRQKEVQLRCSLIDENITRLSQSG